ncbi:DHH family phosphoesterase [Candidatus Peribacteria bacterium]|nr:DHH family phosphoesterase [Candidatus Peribacteria bacterium]
MTPTHSGKTWASAAPLIQLSELHTVLQEKYHLTNPAAVRSYCSPSLGDLHSPWTMADMDSAVQRITTAIERQERIMVYGDFDTDGIMSTVQLYDGLRTLGAAVSYRIPHRVAHSHGLHYDLLDEIISKEVKLLITCDCGSNDAAEVAYIAERGIDVIITDHHHPDPARRPVAATAMVNPHQPHCAYPYKHLSGSAVAFKLLSALGERLLSDQDELAEYLTRYLEPCAIGIIADCMPLTGENRTLSIGGLSLMQQSQWEVIEEILLLTNTHPETIDEDTVRFQIAPRLNAASRLGDVYTAVKAFTDTGETMRRALSQLDTWNEQRKRLTDIALTQSFSQVVPGAPWQLLVHEEWIPGILGLIASKQSERLQVPVIACRLNEDGTVQASCRAPEGYSIIAALQTCPGFFTRVGGHAGAAGFQTTRGQLDAIEQALQGYFAAYTPPPLTQAVDGILPATLLTVSLLPLLREYQPFGLGAAAPQWLLPGCQVLATQLMGSDKTHLKVTVLYDGVERELLHFFGRDDEGQFPPGSEKDMLVTVGRSSFRGEERLALYLVDWREGT